MPRGLSGTQMRNARIIASVGSEMGMNKRQIIIGLITAMTESNLINVKYGDRDSLGLFQQRPSQGWGSPAQVTDPVYASRKFFKTLRQFTGDTRGMPMGVAAQKVQRSAFPGRYNDHIPLMRALYKRIMRGAGVPLGTSGNKQLSDQLRVVAGPTVPPDVLSMASLGTAFTPLDTAGEEQQNTVPVSPLGAMSFSELGVRGESRNMENAGGVYGIAQQMLPMGQDDFVNLMGGGGRFSVELGPGKGGGMRTVHGWRRQVIKAAKTALGTPYRWGGNSLRNGVDCSGLVQEAFQRAGISLPRVSYQQANSGRRIGLRDLKPGDLVAWNNSSRNPGADHIAIYIGRGRIIEAASAGTRVRIRKLGRREGAWGVRMGGGRRFR